MEKFPDRKIRYFRKYKPLPISCEPLGKGVVPTKEGLDNEWVFGGYDLVVGVNNLTGEKIYRYPELMKAVEDHHKQGGNKR